jgi:hypothetical protein
LIDFLADIPAIRPGEHFKNTWLKMIEKVVKLTMTFAILSTCYLLYADGLLYKVAKFCRLEMYTGKKTELRAYKGKHWHNYVCYMYKNNIRSKGLSHKIDLAFYDMHGQFWA